MSLIKTILSKFKSKNKESGTARDLQKLINGMKYHDIMKPIFLGSSRHSIAGYIVLSTLGMEDEAVIAFTHYINTMKVKITLLFDLNKKNYELPWYLVLASPIDQLAASTFSMQKDDPKNINNLGFSIQNPFSRLPIISENVKTTYGRTEILQQLHDELWDYLYSNLNISKEHWKEIKASFAEATKNKEIIKNMSKNDILELKTKINNAIKSNPVLKERLGIHSDPEQRKSTMDLFCERTYPPLNDTSLREHCRLSAALAMVVFSNIIINQKNQEMLQWKIRRKDNIIFINKKRLDDYLNQNKHLDLVKHNVGAKLLKIHFSGLDELQKNADRLDDFHGLRRLVDGYESFNGFRELFRKFFVKDILHEALKIDINPESDHEDILFPLNEFVFDLIYLLPGFIDDSTIKSCINEASLKAWEIIGKDIAARFREDFKESQLYLKLSNQSDNFLNFQKELTHQFQQLRIDNMTQSVEVENNSGFVSLKKNFGKGLLEGYKNLFISNMESKWEFEGEKLTKKEEIEESCETCGINPVWNFFYDFYENADDDEKKLLQKVIYEFRDEPDRLCAPCLAMRILSHGSVTIDWLKDQVEIDQERSRAYVKLKEGLPHPQMTSANLDDRTNTADLGIAFARIKNDRKEVFPTIASVADGESNVALIEIFPVISQKYNDGINSLEEGKGIFGRYEFKEKIDLLLSNDKFSDLADFSKFEKYYIDFCEAYKDDSGTHIYNEMTEIQPHVARVLTRINWISDFYQKLPKIFTHDALIRNLPIETRFPRFLLMVPGNSIVKSLEVIHRVATQELFSSEMYESELESDRETLLEFLDLIIPQLLYCSVIIFKQKQPLYNVMAASQKIINRLKNYEEDWHGILFGLGDYRGILADESPTKVVGTYSTIYHALKISQHVDRRSIMSAELLSQREGIESLRHAYLKIRGGKLNWKDDVISNLKDDEKFKQIHYLKRISN